MKLEVFDERRCILGEGPTSSGSDNNVVTWVDILGHKVFWKDMITHQIGSFDTAAEVGFCLPSADGGHVLGHASGITLRDKTGSETPLLRSGDSIEPLNSQLRWNDAKVSPDGDLFAGTMAFDGRKDAGALYRIPRSGKSIERLISPVSISNGLDWSPDGTLFYFIDTLTFRLDVFDNSASGISNRKTLIHFNETDGMPDGMCSDAEGGLWVAFWGGQSLRRYDTSGNLTLQVMLPAKNVTSCIFAGVDLDTLIITTAKLDDDGPESMQSGMTFMIKPGVKGMRTRFFKP